jgi:hypothetical protein
MCDGQKDEQAILHHVRTTQQAVDTLDAVLGTSGAFQITADRRRRQPPAADDSFDNLDHGGQASDMHNLAATFDELTYHVSDAHPVTP